MTLALLVLLCSPASAAPARALLPPPRPPEAGLVKAYFDAAKAGDLRALAASIHASIAVDYQGEHAPFGQTAYLAAVAARQPAAAALLLSMGADGGAADNLGATAPIYAALNKDLATLDVALAAPGADVAALDRRLRSAFDYARETGDAASLASLERRLASEPPSAAPERYVVVNFLGFGGGGRLEASTLMKDPRVAGVLHVKRSEGAQAREFVERWMAFDRSQGGPRNHQLAIVGASWGSGPSRALARWFEKTFGFPARLHVLVEGANLLGLPFRRIGPADVRRAYHISGWHWPRGGSVRGAENVELGDMDHDSGLALGASRAEGDVAELLARKLRRP